MVIKCCQLLCRLSQQSNEYLEATSTILMLDLHVDISENLTSWDANVNKRHQKPNLRILTQKHKDLIPNH
jgi:hypothetical protein